MQTLYAHPTLPPMTSNQLVKMLIRDQIRARRVTLPTASDKRRINH